MVTVNSGTLKFVPGNYQNNRTCNEATNNYVETLEYVSE